MSDDYYGLLGVSSSATDEEIKRAYRRLARENHPDANPGDARAEARFKEISVAYETLRDPERRRRYDMFGPDGARGTGPAGTEGFGINDLFDAFFGGDPFAARGGTGRAQAPDAEAVVDLTLSEVAFGITTALDVELPTSCDRCDGSGCEPGTHPEPCATCGGAGEVRQVRRSILGQIVTAGPCLACGGTGSTIPSPCNACRGDGRVRATRRLEVEVPAGIDGGQRLRLAGRGPAAPRGGRPGDLYVTVRVAPHPHLQRQGADLFHLRPIEMSQAVLGTTFALQTLDGDEEIDVPPGTQPGRVFRLKGRGVPHLRGRGRGDLLVQVDVRVPEELDAEEEELLRRFAEARGEAVSPPREGGILSKIRSAFQ